MEILGKYKQSSRIYEGEILMDVWMYCPWCGVRQWFKHDRDNIYKCTGHCGEELEMKK